MKTALGSGIFTIETPKGNIIVHGVGTYCQRGNFDTDKEIKEIVEADPRYQELERQKAEEDLEKQNNAIKLYTPAAKFLHGKKLPLVEDDISQKTTLDEVYYMAEQFLPGISKALYERYKNAREHYRFELIDTADSEVDKFGGVAKISLFNQSTVETFATLCHEIAHTKTGTFRTHNEVSPRVTEFAVQKFLREQGIESNHHNNSVNRDIMETTDKFNEDINLLANGQSFDLFRHGHYCGSLASLPLAELITKKVITLDDVLDELKDSYGLINCHKPLTKLGVTSKSMLKATEAHVELSS